MLVAVWDAVKTKTVAHCSRKSKILSESQRGTIAEEDDLFKELEEAIENIRPIEPDFVSENMDAASFTDVDAEVLTVQPLSSEAENIVKLLEAEDVSNDNDDAIETETGPVYYPERKELLEIIETVQKFSLFSKDGAIVQYSVDRAARIIDQNLRKKAGKQQLEIISKKIIKKSF